MQIETKKEKEVKTYKEEVIEIDRGGKKRTIKVREIPIIWEGKEEIVIIKKMSFGERSEFTEKFVNVELVGELSRTNVDMKKMHIETLLMGLHKAPFPIEEDYIDNELDGEIGDLIYKEIEIFNKLDEATQKKSDGQSNMEQKTSESTKSSTTSDSNTISE